MTVTSIITESERISEENDSAAADKPLTFRLLTRQMVVPLVFLPLSYGHHIRLGYFSVRLCENCGSTHLSRLLLRPDSPNLAGQS